MLFSALRLQVLLDGRHGSKCGQRWRLIAFTVSRLTVDHLDVGVKLEVNDPVRAEVGGDGLLPKVVEKRVGHE